MPERPEPTALPQRRHRDDTSPEPSTPEADPRVLRRVAEALGEGPMPGATADRR